MAEIEHDNPLVRALAQAPLFDALSWAELKEIVAHPSVRLEAVPEGEPVFNVGDAPDAFYVIAEGEFEIIGKKDELTPDGFVDDKDHRLNLLFPGEFFGDIGVRYDERRPVHVRAVEESSVLRFDAGYFIELIDFYPWLADRLDTLGLKIEERSIRNFEGQGDDEAIIVYTRRHWMALLASLTQSLFVTILPVLVLFGCVASSAFIARLSDTQSFIDVLTNRANLLSSAFVLSMLLIIFLFWVAIVLWKVIDWRNDYLIVTNERIIYIDVLLFFRNERYEIPLNKVQNVNLTELNPISEYFGYGTLVVDSAAQSSSTLLPPFPYLPEANIARERILFELNRENSRVVQKSRAERKQKLLAALGHAPDPTANTAEEPVVPERPRTNDEAIDRLGLLGVIFRYFYPQSRRMEGSKIVWRKSRWRLTRNIILPSLWLVASIVMVVLINQEHYVAERTLAIVRIPPLVEWSALGWGLLLLYFGAIIGYMMWVYEDWRNEQYILTEDSIIDHNERPFGLSKKIRSASLDMIQNVTYKQEGFYMVLLRIGHVNVQTAGKEGELLFRWVRDPQRVQSDINRYISNRQIQKAKFEAEQVSGELVEWLKIYDDTLRGPDGTGQTTRREATPTPSAESPRRSTSTVNPNEATTVQSASPRARPDEATTVQSASPRVTAIARPNGAAAPERRPRPPAPDDETTEEWRSGRRG